MRPLLVAGVVLFSSVFSPIPSGSSAYPQMLLNYQSEGNVSNCSECASLPVWLSSWFFDGSLTQCHVDCGRAADRLLSLCFISSVPFLKSHALLLSAALLVTLLVSPYLYNYDFLLLLVPFAVLVSSKVISRGKDLLSIVCYLVPTFALLLYGREGNISLIDRFHCDDNSCLSCSAARKNPVIDFTGHAAYNNN